MRSTFALASAFFGVALAAPQGVTDKVTPTGSAPAGCTGTFDGNFEITVTKAKDKGKRAMDLEVCAACSSAFLLVVAQLTGWTETGRVREEWNPRY